MTDALRCHSTFILFYHNGSVMALLLSVLLWLFVIVTGIFSVSSTFALGLYPGLGVVCE